MIRITNISVTERALPVLRKQRERFRPRDPGDVFALAYMSSFTNPDGSSVAGFSPGYMRHSVSPKERGEMWALAQPLDGVDFLFMPKFKWSADDQYIIDLVSEKFELFSIEPAEAG
jgi:hypothetical protein